MKKQKHRSTGTKKKNMNVSQLTQLVIGKSLFGCRYLASASVLSDAMLCFPFRGVFVFHLGVLEETVAETGF